MLQKSTKKFLLLLSISGELRKVPFFTVYKEPVFGYVQRLSCVDLVINYIGAWLFLMPFKLLVVKDQAC